VNPSLDFLLSAIYDDYLAPEHRADLVKSGLTVETIRCQRIRSVPPQMIEALLGFPTPKVTSAYLLPFADPRGAWLDHVRLKVFPSYKDARERTVKYLQPRGLTPRLFLPLVALPAILEPASPLWLIEGEKKSLAGAQLGLAAVGFAGIEGWHVGGSRALLPDFDAIPLGGRAGAGRRRSHQPRRATRRRTFRGGVGASPGVRPARALPAAAA
jgi:hypothetical protein